MHVAFVLSICMAAQLRHIPAPKSTILGSFAAPAGSQIPKPAVRDASWALQEGVAIAFSEAQRNGEPDPERKLYPGGPFDPLGFSKNQAQFDEYKLKELKNGRLAMLAFLGFVSQVHF